MKIWYCICILFFFNCIISLIKDSYELIYVSNEEIDLENYLNSTGILLCISLNSILFSELNYVKISQLKNLTYNKLKKYNEDRFYFFKGYKEIDKDLENPFIFREHLCFEVFDKNKLTWFENVFDGIPSEFYIYNKDTYDFLEIQPISPSRSGEFILSKRFYQLVVLKKEYPYSSCLNNYQKFICLNDCFKKKNRLPKYYYTKNEGLFIHSKSDDKNISSIEKDENECFKRCKKTGCKSVYFFPKAERNLDSIVIKAHVIKSDFEFWNELIGLICLFNNITFYQIFTGLIHMISLKFKKNLKRVKKLKKKLKKTLKYFYHFESFFVIFISLSFFSGLLYKIIHDFKTKTAITKEATSTLIVLEPFALVFCVSFLYSDFSDIFTNDDFQKIDDNKTALELEKESNVLLEELLDSIYIEFLNKKQQIDWHLEPNVYFTYEIFQEGSVIRRCFKITISLKEVAKYQSLFLNTRLIIKLKRNYDYDIFLLPESQNFTTNSFKYDLNSDFLKKIKKRSKLSKRMNKCIDYREKYSYCYSQSSCVDFCIQNEYYKKYKAFSMNAVVDKDLYTKDQWSTAYINVDLKSDEKIEENCRKLFNDLDCEIEVFTKSVPNSNLADSMFLNLDLNYEVLSIFEEDISFHKLALDILNLQGILFGMNVLRLGSILIYFLKLKNRKFFSYFSIFCGIGFSLHSYFIFAKIIENELVPSQYYENLDQLIAPDFAFCYEIKRELIDENHQLTGNYLNKITNDLNKKSIFQKIEYLNEIDKWVALDEKSEFETSQFKMDTFYFEDQKCFKIKLEMTYSNEKFYFKNENTILRIFFNYTIFLQNKNIYFYTIVKNTNQFSKPNMFNYYYRPGEKQISINQDLYEIDYNDKFNLIKYPLSLFYTKSTSVNDVDSYLKNLFTSYKQIINYNTLSLPLKSSYFNELIDNELFEQFYYQIQNISDYNSTPNPNYKRSFALNSWHIRNNYQEYRKADIIFNIVFFKKILLLTNEDNYAKLVLNLLNTLSLWLNYSPLDLHVYVCKFVTCFSYPYKFFLKIKLFLKLILNKEGFLN